ncbi:lipase secretion chaperone [Halopseudomonas pelagia]|uniref:Lipase chaperone n=1 Tax=Halopseudomonas pelagia TaxID=553151 RepID=A0AA91U3A4_9GAMM|nr:lipase secretion chaperone [Halopseudomonas pelagia]PCC99636.1 lipase chaperone [Halopseudomonas pelagia]QFY54912.1 lipase secretion chaperone [Halopseudomonas pelagia]QFY58597.1 lipase secretion chaperone [Halopseudomonas pelagia]
MKVLIYLPFAAAALLVGWQLLAPEDAVVTERAKAPQAAAPTPTYESMQHIPNRLGLAAPTDGIESLRETEVDGTLEVDAQGNLVISEQLRHLFDYFFTAVGEISFEEAAERIRIYLASQLQDPALGQSLTLLQNYIDYKTALVELEQGFPVVADIAGLRARQDEVQRLRARLFSPEAHAAFFAAEEIYNHFTLERLAILQDPNLTDDDKASMIENLRQSLPDDVQDLLIPQIHQELTVQTEQLLEQGADPSEVRELRLSLVGPEATGRLEDLDQERQQWQQRMDDFSAEREAILSYNGLAEEDKQAAIEELLESRFNANERLRVSSLLDMTAE